MSRTFNEMACRYIQVQTIKKVNHVFASKLDITKDLLLTHHFFFTSTKLNITDMARF